MLKFFFTRILFPKLQIAIRYVIENRKYFYKKVFFAVVDTFCAQSAERNLDYYLNLNAIFLQRYLEINSNNPEKRKQKF